MRTKRATRFNHEREHASYGVYNWFKSKGIKTKAIIMETMYNFCEVEGFKGLSKDTQDYTMSNFISNRFSKFASFATNFLIENNYLKK